VEEEDEEDLELKKKEGAMVMTEEQATGVVPLSIYLRYFKMGGVSFFMMTLVIFMAAQALRIFTDYWLGIWA
jgi:hypothetical protein